MKITALLALFLASCTVVKVPVPTGGSRADGTIELSYEVGGFQKAQINLQQAKQSALRRCQAWDYTDAERFGGHKSFCQYQSQSYGCLRWLITMTYQCTGKS